MDHKLKKKLKLNITLPNIESFPLQHFANFSSNSKKIGINFYEGETFLFALLINLWQQAVNCQ